MASTPASELHTLTLDHILSDLESLPSNHGLFELAKPSQAEPSTHTVYTSDHLTAFEGGSSPSNRKEYVVLSHQLLESFRTAQRLNTEQVSAGEVGLVLPSERNAAGPSSGGRSGNGGGVKGSRTDLLHKKVADLQTLVDAWDGSLERAMAVADGTQRRVNTASGMQEDVKASVSVSGTAANRVDPIESTSDHPTSSVDTTPSKHVQTHENPKGATSAPIESQQATINPEEIYEDDDPWNDLT
ncbi:uncharacterized protein UTRI_02904 [Ustilago trichophora]|uniref:Uncharacterized protein n=1 Tax=Ustilago trichophora TaxID=86804 RepID=A0A5C3ERF8_9BASI|nr:uncharacterized protein UTRI_02904 [Ustilago trichophora]